MPKMTWEVGRRSTGSGSGNSTTTRWMATLILNLVGRVWIGDHRVQMTLLKNQGEMFYYQPPSLVATLPGQRTD